MNRIKEIFKSKTNKVIPFLTAGYPEKKYTLEMVLAAEAAGACMVELGMPFSDPLADGPVIQKSSQIALSNGVTVSWILNLVREIRKRSEIPLALMGYVNPIIKYGLNEFLTQAKDCGVDGLIIPDLPHEEGESYIEITKEKNMSPILLVAPNTPSDRIKIISLLARDLIYCVSILGITGSFNSNNNIDVYLKRVKKYSTCSFVVGFGIKNNSDVMSINKHADGAVVGSAIIEMIGKSNDPIQCVRQYVKDLIK